MDDDEEEKLKSSFVDDAYFDDDYDGLGVGDSDSHSYDNENSNYNYNDLLNRKADEGKDIKSKYIDE